MLGAPVGRFAKPVGANAPELFFFGPQRNIMIHLAIPGALGVLAVFLRPILDKSVILMDKFLVNLIKLIISKLSLGGYVLFKPRYIQLEPTILCNLRCTTCNQEIKKRSEKRTMTLDEFKYIVDQFKTLKYLNLTGYGEPLLNEHIFDMVKYAAEKKIKTHFATNSTMLGKPGCAQTLIDSGLYSLIFSIDAADKKTFESIRVGANFDNVISNIETFQKANREAGQPVMTQIYFVATQDNLDQIEAMVELGAKLGVDNIRIQNLYDHSGEGGECLKRAAYSKNNLQNAREALGKAAAKAKELAVKIERSPLGPNWQYVCRMPFYYVYITVEGDVTPCCLQGVDPRVVSFGNLHQKTFDEIWNGPEIRAFRKALRSKNPPPICKSCPRLHGLV